MSFPYKHVLLVGASSGIGLALAERLVQDCKVTVVGRRRKLLDEFVAKYGSKAQAITFDLADIEKAPQFAADVIKGSPDIDCIFLNAGFLENEDFSKPESVDMKAFNQVMKVNFTSFVVLTHAFLPYLLGKEKTSFIYTTSNLAIVPAVHMTSYSASKAALHAFILCLRNTLRNTSVNVVELLPPLVATQIHGLLGPDGHPLGMPLEDFTTRAYTGLISGEDTVYIGDGPSSEGVGNIIAQRRVIFDEMSEMIRTMV
ncbi:hypothetical protein OCU04_012646 [Sclerotinia nivalis]|uniref:Uncharacterized protein n=1 Tax=Sclerotinia nivalis TaxID=352851 RepID=A0A9X0DF36_9HELO|nr:hypothetical protein OCU04_012646 [Sclerotinia nivalis]